MTPKHYASLGYDVFPCAGKVPRVRKGTNWQEVATRAVGDGLFLPGDNIGLVVPIGAVVIDLDRKPACPGKRAGAVCPTSRCPPAPYKDAVDCDGKPRVDGVADLLRLRPAGWEHRGPRALTGSGGFHLWFSTGPLWCFGNSRGAFPTSIDVRGGGRGYVVVPPSVHPETGRPYVWKRPLEPVSELPRVPDWIVDKLLAQPAGAQPGAPKAHLAQSQRNLAPYLAQALADEARKVREAPDGGGNDQINRSAFKLGQLAGEGLGYDVARAEIAAALGDWTWRRPKDEAAAWRTFDSGWRAGERNPRRIG